MDMDMKFFRKLPVPKELKEQFPADERIVKIKQEEFIVDSTTSTITEAYSMDSAANTSIESYTMDSAASTITETYSIDSIADTLAKAYSIIEEGGQPLASETTCIQYIFLSPSHIEAFHNKFLLKIFRVFFKRALALLYDIIIKHKKVKVKKILKSLAKYIERV